MLGHADGSMLIAKMGSSILDVSADSAQKLSFNRNAKTSLFESVRTRVVVAIRMFQVHGTSDGAHLTLSQASG